MLCATVVSSWAIGGDGLYFANSFEASDNVPAMAAVTADTEMPVTITGQGEWIYYNAFYNDDTSTGYMGNGIQNLRLPKKGYVKINASDVSYVASPLLSNGVSKVTFYIGRGSVVVVKVYASTDGGTTWTAVETTSSGKTVTANINNDAVNRIKISNESTSKDADIDDVAIYAQTYDTPVTLTTGDATDIAKTSVTLSGTITKQDESVTEVGFVWSYSNKEPTFNDKFTAASAAADNFSVQLTELAEGKTYYYRAYAKYGDTQAYGEVKSFKTLMDESAQTIDSEGRYFIQDFEDISTYPSKSEGEGTNTELSFNAYGGEWLYYNSFEPGVSTRVASGTYNLRMPKKGSYVITPILNSGVKKVTWNQTRSEVTAYTSTDGGTTWKTATITSSDKVRTIEVNDLSVNRIKIANDSGSDADIDDIIVYAQAFGTPATVATGDAMNITKNTAEVGGQIVDPGDQPLADAGIIWALHNQPSLSDNVIKVEDTKIDNKDITEFSLLITGLKAEQTVYYRAYVLSNAGYAYGDIKSFVTAEATPAIVATSDVTKSGKKYRLGGIVTDDGGMDLTEVGIIYSTASGLDYNTGTRVPMANPSNKFSISVALEEATTYYVCAYAITGKGTVYGEEKQFVTDEVPDTPDEIKGEVIWMSPDGDDATADGSEEHPFFDLQKAVDIAQPGDRIWMKAGTYVYNKRINIDDKNGKPDKLIEVWGKDGQAILDFSGMPYHEHSNNPYQGVRLTSSYWHFKNIDITNASDNGLLIERNKPAGGSSADVVNRTQDGHDNIIELCNFYKNGDTGLQIKNLGSNNKIINCDSYLNCDEDEGDADGFAPKISVGDNNYFYGCRAWANSDDGWDVFYKKDGNFGDNMTIIMEYCISYKNGFLDLNTIAPGGNGNGFKCGSDQGAMNVYLNRCLAVHNKLKGFDQNHNAGDIILNNCTGMTSKEICGEKAYSYRIFEEIASGHEVRLTNCIAINENYDTDKRDKATGQPNPREHGKPGKYGRFEVDESLTGLTVTNCEFHKAHPDLFESMDDEQLIADRDEDGNLPEITFAHIKAGGSHTSSYDKSSWTSEDLLIDKGVEVPETTYRGIYIKGISFEGTAPDLGAFEFGGSYTDVKLIKQESADKSVSLFQAQNGLVFVTVNDAAKSRDYTLNLYDATGSLLGQHNFNGATTAISLPQGANGLVIIEVKSAGGFVGSAKAVVK